MKVLGALFSICFSFATTIWAIKLCLNEDYTAGIALAVSAFSFGMLGIELWSNYPAPDVADGEGQ